MEKKLKKLFDYQRFEKNERLAGLIAQTEERCAKELSDEELETVAAAGDITIRNHAAGQGGGIYNETKKKGILS